MKDSLNSQSAALLIESLNNLLQLHTSSDTFSKPTFRASDLRHHKAVMSMQKARCGVEGTHSCL